MANRRPAKKTVAKPRPEVEQTPQVSESTLSRAEQAAVDAENVKYQDFVVQVKTQYLESRVGDLSVENTKLKEQNELLQRRVRELESDE